MRPAIGKAKSEVSQARDEIAADAAAIQKSLTAAFSPPVTNIKSTVVRAANDALDAFMSGMASRKYSSLEADVASMASPASSNPFASQQAFDAAVRKRKWNDAHVSAVDNQFSEAMGGGWSESRAESALKANQARQEATQSAARAKMMDQAWSEAANVIRAEADAERKLKASHERNEARRQQAVNQLTAAHQQETNARKSLAMSALGAAVGFGSAYAGSRAVMSGVGKASPITMERFQKSIDDLQAVMSRPFIPAVNGTTGLLRNLGDRFDGMSPGSQAAVSYGIVGSVGAASLAAGALGLNAATKAMGAGSLWSLGGRAVAGAARFGPYAAGAVGLGLAADSVFNEGQLRKDAAGFFAGKKGNSFGASGFQVDIGNSDSVYELTQKSALREGIMAQDAEKKKSEENEKATEETMLNVLTVLKKIADNTVGLVDPLGVNDMIFDTAIGWAKPKGRVR